MREPTVTPDGARIGQLRRAKNWTQATFVEKVGRSLKTIENAEAGKPVNEVTLKEIAQALGVDYQSLIAFNNDPAPATKIPPEPGALRPGLTAGIPPLGAANEKTPREPHPSSNEGGAASIEFQRETADCFRRIPQNFSDAIERFGDDSKSRQLIERHILSLSRALELASEHLRAGEIVAAYEDCSLLTKHVEGLSKGEELLGLTDWELDRRWWRTPDAQKFLAANSQALRQGAVIRRIFIYDGCEERTQARELENEMAHHAEIGVQVRVMERASLPRSVPELRSQCVILDAGKAGIKRGWLTYRVDLDARKHPVKNIFSVRRETIEGNQRFLEEMWQSGGCYPTLATPRPPAKQPAQNKLSASNNCGQASFGQCEEPTETLSATQLVPAGQNDGRRLYIHETAFYELATLGRDISVATYSCLTGIPIVKLAHHDLVEESVLLDRFSRETAQALETAISNRWFNEITEFLRQIGYVPDDALRKHNFDCLLGPGERIMATCYDAAYYTFATSDEAAHRMFNDFLKLTIVQKFVNQKGDPYRDVTMIKGKRLASIDKEIGVGVGLAKKYESRMRSLLTEQELFSIKREVMDKFGHDLRTIILEQVPSPNLTEAEVLHRFESKCLKIIKSKVLRF